jgi:hypothetical protein
VVFHQAILWEMAFCYRHCYLTTIQNGYISCHQQRKESDLSGAQFRGEMRLVQRALKSTFV